MVVIDLTEVTSGFCDRLRVVTLGIALAQWRKTHLLHIIERPTQTCPYAFDEVCRVEGFEVTLGKIDKAPDISTTAHDLFPSDLNDVRRQKPPEVTLSDVEFRELWLDSYRLLRPAPSLIPSLDALALEPDCVGLHLRYTDRIAWLGSAYWLGQWPPWQMPWVERNALRLVQQFRPRQIYLASDEPLPKARWTQRLQSLGYQVVSHPASFSSQSLRQTNAHDFGVDLFALARCQAAVGLHRSGLINVADWSNGKREPFLIASESMTGWGRFNRLLYRALQPLRLVWRALRHKMS